MNEQIQAFMTERAQAVGHMYTYQCTIL
jgi:hypothetical protein